MSRWSLQLIPSRFRAEDDVLAPTAVIRVEVHLEPIVHEVPMKALERWAHGPSTSPKEELLKRPFRRA